MLNRIIEFSIKNKLIVGLFVLGLIVYGSYQFTKLPIDAVPDITDNQVQIITTAPSLGATDIERLITFPIEVANSNISGLKEMRSFSRFGLSLVTVVFNDDVDIYWARQQIAERLQQVQTQIPPDLGSISMGPVTTGLGEIYQYTIRAKPGYEKQYNAMELRTIQDWMVRRQLLGVKGVADVSSFGGKVKQYEIAVDPNKLKAYNITINDVFEALQSNNQNTGGAYIEKGPTVLYIRSEGLITNTEDIKTICVKKIIDGTPLLLKDVAEIRWGYATRYGAMTYNDQGEVAGAVVMMLKGENSSEVIDNVKERIEKIKKTLPEGVVIEPFLDRTKMVNNAMSTVATNLMEGALIVIFVLVLFLGNIRAGILVASVIPLAMLFAIIMMNLFGVSGNLMSLGALDFGLIIDGAVIIVESVMHQLIHTKKITTNTSLSQDQMDNEVKFSASKMMNSAVFGQVIILVVYLPIFFLEGIEGKMFKPMVQTVVFALLGAFLLSLTYIPMMSALIISKKTAHAKTFSDRMMETIEARYQLVLVKLLAIPKLVLIVTVVLFSIALLVLSNMGGEFIPALEEGDFAIETRVLPGSNLNTMIESTQKAAHILKTRFPEVEQVVTKIGSGEIPTDPMPMEAADMMVILKDKKEWVSAKTFDELTEKMTVAIADVPGITVGFQFPVQMRFNELMTGAKQDVVCKIFGENMDTLAYYAQKLGAISGTIDGAKEVYVEPVTGLPQVIITYNRAALARFGLNINDVNKVVNTGLAGQSTGIVFEGEKRFDMVVRIDNEHRKSVEDIANILIATPDGIQVPLNQLANVELKETPNQIQREDAKRRIIVGFNVHERDVQSIVEDLQTKVEKQIQLPEGYYITYGGAFENLNAAKKRLGITVPISLLLILVLLYFSFNSLKQGLLIYSAIPLSAIGGIFALALRGMPFSISAGVGFIALFGVAVLNGIVLVAEFNRLKNEGMSDLKKIVIQGTTTRLRPVLMTALVASLGFLPMALSNGSGAEVQRPLATVVIGGLLIATFLTLFVLPILYLLFENKNNSKINASVVLLIMMFASLWPNKSGYSQTTITLQSAIDTALKNNLVVKNQKLYAEYQQKIKGTAFDVSKTNVNTEYGQINSFYNDTKFGIYQSLSFPNVYTKQRSLLNEQYNSEVLNVALKEAELKKQVYELFYNLLYLQEKKIVLSKNDSIYQNFLTKAQLRFEKGASNVLEKSTAEVQRGQIAIQLNQVNSDIDILMLQFNLLLNSTAMYVPKAEQFKMNFNPQVDTSILIKHPLMQVFEKQKQISVLNTQVQKTKLFPDINIGYSNMSITGMGADNVYYTKNNRFQSIQMGLAVPLFFGSQRSKIKALRVEEIIAQNNYLYNFQSLQTEYLVALKEYEKQKQTVTYFEASALKNADAIFSACTQQFNSGDIDYLEWTLLLNQAIGIQSQYIDAVKEMNQSIIQLNYLTSK